MHSAAAAAAHVKTGDGGGPPLKHQEAQAVWQREFREPLVQLPLQQAAGAGCLRHPAAQQRGGVGGSHPPRRPGVQAADGGRRRGGLEHAAPAGGRRGGRAAASLAAA